MRIAAIRIIALVSRDVDRVAIAGICGAHASAQLTLVSFSSIRPIILSPLSQELNAILVWRVLVSVGGFDDADLIT